MGLKFRNRTADLTSVIMGGRLTQSLRHDTPVEQGIIMAGGLAGAVLLLAATGAESGPYVPLYVLIVAVSACILAGISWMFAYLHGTRSEMRQNTRDAREEMQRIEGKLDLLPGKMEGMVEKHQEICPNAARIEGTLDALPDRIENAINRAQRSEAPSRVIAARV